MYDAHYSSPAHRRPQATRYAARDHAKSDQAKKILANFVPFLAATLIGLGFSLITQARADEPAATKPLSPAQIALFETPHLASIDRPETLTYRFTRQGPNGFTDQVVENIKLIHPDGTKYVMFNFLTGERHVFYPAVDDFRGNPLLMVFLEHDVDEMRAQTGVAASYFRNRIRDAFIDKAEIKPTTVTIGGHDISAESITLRPFAENERLEHIPQIQKKLYRFVLSKDIPGGFAEFATEEPADPAAGAPATSEELVFDKANPETGTKP